MLDLHRRDVIVQGSAALAAMAAFYSARSAGAFPTRPGDVVVPWLDQPDPNPVPEVIKTQLVWEDLDSWVTPNDKFFSIAHFDRPTIDADDLEARSRRPGEDAAAACRSPTSRRGRGRRSTFTVECSGNHGFPFFTGGIGNAAWAGTPLAAVLEEAGVLDSGIEVVFWGTDAGDVEIHDDIRDVKMHQNFARSMSLADAMSPDNILCYEMNGADLPAPNGSPAAADRPGLVRHRQRQVAEAHRGPRPALHEPLHGARLRHHPRGGARRRDGLGRDLGRPRPAEVGAGAGHPERRRLPDRRASPGARRSTKVEVKIDDGPWQQATIDHSEEAEHAWKVWSLDWPAPAPGEHTVTSRATDASGQVQPAMDDPLIAKKHTYWESNGQVTRRVAIS